MRNVGRVKLYEAIDQLTAAGYKAVREGARLYARRPYEKWHYMAIMSEKVSQRSLNALLKVDAS